MTRSFPPAAVGFISIVLTLLAWSSVPLFLKHFAASIDAWTSNGWRYGFAALLWAPVLVVAGYRRRLPAGLWRAALVPSIINGAGQVCFTLAHYKIDPGLLTFGLRSQLLFAAVGAYVLFPMERRIIRSRRFLLGVVVVTGGTAGAVLLGRQPVVGAHAAGVILSVGSGFLFGAYGLAVRKYMHQVNPVIAFAAISQFTAAAMVALMLIRGESFGLMALTLPTSQFVLLLVSAVIGIAIGHVLYYTSIARLGVAVSAGVLQLHPFGVAVGSFLLFREILTPAQWISGSIALAGAGLMVAAQARVSRAEQLDLTDRAIAQDEGGL